MVTSNLNRSQLDPPVTYLTPELSIFGNQALGFCPGARFGPFSKNVSYWPLLWHQLWRSHVSIQPLMPSNHLLNSKFRVSSPKNVGKSQLTCFFVQFSNLPLSWPPFWRSKVSWWPQIINSTPNMFSPVPKMHKKTPHTHLSVIFFLASILTSILEVTG